MSIHTTPFKETSGPLCALNRFSYVKRIHLSSTGMGTLFNLREPHSFLKYIAGRSATDDWKVTLNYRLDFADRAKTQHVTSHFGKCAMRHKSMSMDSATLSVWFFKRQAYKTKQFYLNARPLSIGFYSDQARID